MPDLTYPGLDDIQRRVLPNGCVVLVYENFASQSVVVDGFIRAGGLAEDRQTAGLANFVSSCLMRGTEKRSFNDIYEELESTGASMGFSAGYFTTSFSGSSLIEDLPLLLDLLAQSLRRPTFPEGQVEQMRHLTTTGLQMRANDTRQMASLKFYETLYENHPYGRSLRGYLDTVPGFTSRQLADFHNTYYGARGMVLTIAGAVKADEAFERVTAVFGDWQEQDAAMPPMPEGKRPSAAIHANVHLPQKSQSDLVIGLPGPPRSAPDYLNVSMMNTILGVFGMMGRIGANVREKQGLAYYAYSHLQGGLGPSPWYAAAGVAPDKIEQTTDAILHEIKRIQTERVSDEELADSKAYRIGSMPVGLETNAGMAGIITDMEMYGLGLDYLQQFPDKINAVSAEDIQQAAQTHLSAEQLVIAAAGS